MEIIVSVIIFAACIIRVVSYGVYTLKCRNITGACGLFVLAALTAAAAAVTFTH